MKKKTIENDEIVKNIVEGIQEKKGKEIVVVNLNKLPEAPCSYFVICQGDLSTQVNSIAISVKDYVNEKIKVKPYASDGFENCQWIAMDYGQIIVHIFQRVTREFYDIEHLWEDANLQRIPNLD
ncbi:MAG: ribosome silencing factor [Paludibacteraceae bacterium]